MPLMCGGYAPPDRCLKFWGYALGAHLLGGLSQNRGHSPGIYLAAVGGA